MSSASTTGETLTLTLTLYQEQREAIEKQKVAKMVDKPATQDELLAFSANLQREIEAYRKS